RELRERQKRNLLTTLVLARGVPMLTAGDELGRTQRGNNNAYCHDDESTWLDWDLDDARRALLLFTRRLLARRRGLAVVRLDAFFGGEIWDTSHPDLRWYHADGSELHREDWKRPFLRSLQLLFGHTSGKNVLWLLHADAEPRAFTIPPRSGAW